MRIILNENKGFKKPWGNVRTIFNRSDVAIKILYVNPSSRLSLQLHRRRDEVWFLIDGEAICQLDEQQIKMQKGIAYYIPKETKHRLIAGKAGCKVLEISIGQIDELDIIRLDDDYGRK